MDVITMIEKETGIYQQYRDVIAPFIAELEVRDTEYSNMCISMVEEMQMFRHDYRRIADWV